jgi:hypothetical protein
VQVRGAEQRNEGIRLLRDLLLNETDPALQKQYMVCSAASASLMRELTC